MDMLKTDQLQIIVDYINQNILIDGDHWLWNKRNYNNHNKDIRIFFNNNSKNGTRAIDYMWQHHYGTSIPARINHICEHNRRCLNPAHKQQEIPKPRYTPIQRTPKSHKRWTNDEINWLKNNLHLTREQQMQHLQRSRSAINRQLYDLGHNKQRTRYLYQRHTTECQGIDPVVIDRIVAAGTIEQFAQQHPVCDCERAYILKYVPDAYRILLAPRTAVQQRLNAIPV